MIVLGNRGMPIYASELQGYGQKTVAAAGTAEAVVSSETDYNMVQINALPTNTGNVYIGDSSVSSSTGYVLDAGDTIILPIKDLSTIYVDADTAGEGISWIAY